MRPGSPTLDLHFMHQDQVVDLPPGATLVGKTDHCPNAMFAVGSAFGVQAHPEFVPEYTEALLLARQLRIGAATTDAALASLRQPTDEGLIARWALRLWAG
jgi:GMP synthase (glutamine-hydrolysing)